MCAQACVCAQACSTRLCFHATSVFSMNARLFLPSLSLSLYTYVFVCVCVCVCVCSHTYVYIYTVCMYVYKSLSLSISLSISLVRSRSAYPFHLPFSILLHPLRLLCGSCFRGQSGARVGTGNHVRHPPRRHYVWINVHQFDEREREAPFFS